MPSFVNPVTGDTQNVLYYANKSEVPLLVNPSNLAGGWSGGAYARYLGDAYNDNDADTVRGRVTVGTGAGKREWMGWEPMASDDPDHGAIKVKGVNVQNNLDNRDRQLAENIKNEGIKLYVIGLDLAGNTHAPTFLQDLASPADESGTYFFDAPNPSDLQAVFKQIAASLSTLHISM